MEIGIGILRPFIGTAAGAACVFFLKKEIGGRTQKIFLGFAAGVMVPLCGGLAESVRAELEYGLLNKTHNNITAGRQSVTMQTKLQTAFLNLYYDLDTSTSLTPYFGFGLGYAHINEKAFEKVSEDNFAYNVGAGVSFNFSYNTDFELGYRYTNYKKIKERTPDDYAKRDYDSHEVLLGIRYTF